MSDFPILQYANNEANGNGEAALKITIQNASKLQSPLLITTTVQAINTLCSV